MVALMSVGSSSCPAPPSKSRFRKRLRACFPPFRATETAAAAPQPQRATSVVTTPAEGATASALRCRSDVAGASHLWSAPEMLSARSSQPTESLRDQCRHHSSYPCSLLSTTSSSSTRSSTTSGPRKGVTYGCDGALVSCRFCEILKSGNEPFLYEDEDVTVFRPLAPVVVSHILVVPRRHIRNVNELTLDDVALLHHMREVAANVLREMPRPSRLLAPLRKAERTPGTAVDSAGDDDDFKFAFHSPPFNSIDHVHMHAFRTRDGRVGCADSIKYHTETWWCRSFDEVTTRLGLRDLEQREADAAAQGVGPCRSRSLLRRDRTGALVPVQSKV
ncbi:unnamed protein product [Hyaloperonospora brassicae]|uniref:HIT domain-containing protein n=1 Tax=Hyaloperonospora brassicae TaxID=162125 RepID=A0AAV0T8K4_HYABA|nr:unnamed protein product [Hyaloperonospora brassicae]